MPANARKEKNSARQQLTKRPGVVNARRTARADGGPRRAGDGPTSSQRRTSRPTFLFRASPLRAAMTAIDSLLDRSGRVIEEGRKEIVQRATALGRLFRRTPQKTARARYH
jgi:hypothetical protein